MARRPYGFFDLSTVRDPLWQQLSYRQMIAFGLLFIAAMIGGGIGGFHWANSETLKEQPFMNKQLVDNMSGKVGALFIDSLILQHMVGIFLHGLRWYYQQPAALDASASLNSEAYQLSETPSRSRLQKVGDYVKFGVFYLSTSVFVTLIAAVQVVFALRQVPERPPLSQAVKDKDSNIDIAVLAFLQLWLAFTNYHFWLAQRPLQLIDNQSENESSALLPRS